MVYTQSITPNVQPAQINNVFVPCVVNIRSGMTLGYLSHAAA